MNDRIRELAEQATIKSVSENFTGEKFEIVTPSKEWAEKFAELIIQECCSIADGWVDDTDNGQNYPSEIIKQHFGRNQ